MSEELNPREGVIHPEVRAPSDESERGPDGRRLQHAEAASKPIRADAPREPQPRGAKIKGNRPIDQGEAAERFLAAPLHQKAHDERLWDVRKKRDTAAHGIPEWEELREIASQIKAHTLTHLDDYLAQSRRRRRPTASTSTGPRTGRRITASSSTSCRSTAPSRW